MLSDSVFVQTINASFLDQIKASKRIDMVVLQAQNALSTHGPWPMRSSSADWSLDNGLLLYRNAVYVPPEESLRHEATRLHHDLPSMGHPGIQKTLLLLKCDFWWPGMSSFVTKYVQGCGECQQIKVNTHPTIAPAIPIRANPNATPFSCISTDFITDLPSSNGFNSIMVMVDHDLMKGVIFTLCLKTIDAIGTVKILHTEVYKWFGLPRKIISDCGPQYASRAFQELCCLTGIESAMSTAFHPQTDRETECVNQELEVYLWIFAANHPTDWVTYLPDAQFAHNNQDHSATKASPFYLIMGYHLRAMPHVTEQTNAPSMEQRLKELEKARDEALAAHELSRKIMEDRV